MRFLSAPPPYDLAYSDVFMVPRRSAVSSRLDVDLASTDGLGTTLPLVVANMTAISGRRMAETVARRGGIAILPQDIPTEVVASVVAKVKGSHPVYDTPVTGDRHTTAAKPSRCCRNGPTAWRWVGEDGRPLGTVSEADAAGVDQFARPPGDVGRHASRSTPTHHRPTSSKRDRRHLGAALVLDGDGGGVMTGSHALRSTLTGRRPTRTATDDRRRGRKSTVMSDRARSPCSTRGSMCWWSTPRHGPQDRMLSER